jgi:hypothetical protein
LLMLNMEWVSAVLLHVVAGEAKPKIAHHITATASGIEELLGCYDQRKGTKELCLDFYLSLPDKITKSHSPSTDLNNSHGLPMLQTGVLHVPRSELDVGECILSVIPSQNICLCS